ncbi:MAG: hypothetical protein LBT38_11050 [Deltaproteobacteria bacterium]|nr:hypothetical protein [Deltaproteobacteria bacterium]
MLELSQRYCPNEKCRLYKVTGADNRINIRKRYGSDKRHILLYCRECGASFSDTTGTMLFRSHLKVEDIQKIIKLSTERASVRSISKELGISKDSICKMISKISLYCANLLSEMLQGLGLNESQLDELMLFLKKNDAMSRLRKRRNLKEEKKLGS